MLDRRVTAGQMTATTRRRIATLPRRPGLPACTTSECVARLGRDRPRLRVTLRSSIQMHRRKAWKGRHVAWIREPLLAHAVPAGGDLGRVVCLHQGRHRGHRACSDDGGSRAPGGSSALPLLGDDDGLPSRSLQARASAGTPTLRARRLRVVQARTADGVRPAPVARRGADPFLREITRRTARASCTGRSPRRNGSWRRLPCRERLLSVEQKDSPLVTRSPFLRDHPARL